MSIQRLCVVTRIRSFFKADPLIVARRLLFYILSFVLREIPVLFVGWQHHDELHVERIN